MNYTRKYYEEFLDVLDETTSMSNNDFDKLNVLKEKLDSIIQRTLRYDILNLEVPQQIKSELTSRQKNNFAHRQSKIAEFLYNSLGKLLFTFERTERTTDYATALELYRTELPFEVVSQWDILVNESREFSMELLFFDMHKQWTEIDKESEFNDYKERLRSKKVELRYLKKSKRINKKQLEKLTKHFQTKLDIVVNYIETHYPEIKREFSLFDCNIRIYVVDRKGVPGETTKQTKFYKDLKPKNKVVIYPFLLNMASRFNNLEEIELDSKVYSESLFDIKEPEKYGGDFDLGRVHFELLYIFLKNCTNEQKKEFLKYLIKSSLNSHITEGDAKDELLIFRNEKCKLFIDNTPNLNSIERLTKKEEYTYVAFTNRPDEETYRFLREFNIKSIVVDEIARHYINIGNGALIHYYIKERLQELNIKASYPNKGQELISRLKNCPLGMEGWAEFEDIGTEAFEYLFADNFRSYTKKTQSYTNDKIFRRDLIVNNNYSDTTSIWGQAKTDFNCKLIVIDFKNYSDPLEQNEFYMPSKYLNLNTGKFGILFTRKGIGNSAKTLQKRMLNLNEELLIVLSENDLIQMINEKSLNQDPSYRLENIKFSLYETT